MSHKTGQENSLAGVRVIRDVGKMGEATFETWCSSVGLTANPSEVDRTGWDYLVEFPMVDPPGQPKDLAPAGLECRVQVKATDGERRKWDIRVPNLERLAKAPVPAFVCILEFGGMDTPQSAYLIHVGEEVIERTLKRLRRQHANGTKGTKDAKLTIAYGDADKLSEPNGACLKQAIESHIPDGFDKYCQWKKRLLETVGYEHGHGYMSMQVRGSDPIDDLIRLSIGLQKSLKVSKLAMHDTRFGVDCQIPLPHENAEISVSPGALEGVVGFRERKSAPAIEFRAKVHHPSINRLLPRERITTRVETKFFDIIGKPFKGEAKFSLKPGVGMVRASLAEAKNFLTLMCMMRQSGAEGISMDLSVGDQEFPSVARMIVHHHMNDLTAELRTVEQAVVVARVYGIEHKLLISIDDILGQEEPICGFYNVIEGRTEGSTATFFIDEAPADIRATSAVIFHGSLHLTDYILHCIVGMIGPLEQIGDKQYRLVSHGRCLYRPAITSKDCALDSKELQGLTDSLEAEIRAKDISPAIILAN